MARTEPQTGAAVSAGSGNVFFTRERYERANESLTRRVRRHAVADYSWFPDLVEVGGYHYEAGERLFEGWAALLNSLLGDSIQPLLREAWECIPRAAAEKFAAFINGVLSERERIRIEHAYRQLKFPLAGVNPDVLLTSNPTEGTGSEGATVHEHTCARCGMPFRHEAWECEPPSDTFCNLCEEQALGPMPVWIQRWKSAVEDPAAASPTQAGTSGKNPLAKHALEPQPDPATAATEPKAPVVPNPTERGLDKVAGMDELKALLYDEVVPPCESLTT